MSDVKDDKFTEYQSWTFLTRGRYSNDVCGIEISQKASDLLTDSFMRENPVITHETNTTEGDTTFSSKVKIRCDIVDLRKTQTTAPKIPETFISAKEVEAYTYRLYTLSKDYLSDYKNSAEMNRSVLNRTWRIEHLYAKLYFTASSSEDAITYLNSLANVTICVDISDTVDSFTLADGTIMYVAYLYAKNGVEPSDTNGDILDILTKINNGNVVVKSITVLNVTAKIADDAISKYAGFDIFTTTSYTGDFASSIKALDMSEIDNPKRLKMSTEFTKYNNEYLCSSSIAASSIDIFTSMINKYINTSSESLMNIRRIDIEYSIESKSGAV